LAAAVSVVVFEARRESDERASVPRGPVGDAIDETLKLWSELETAEAEHGLSLTREPDLGFVWPIYRWAHGETLSKVLASGADAEMPAGDFVRWARQVVDLLGQIAQATGDAEMRRRARAAIDGLTRGILAYANVT
jgi:ATP-dependent RNA helicase HelY